MLSHSLTNFEIQKYYENKHNFNNVHSRNILAQINDRAYKVNMEDYESIGTYWIALYINTKNARYFHSFGSGHIPKEIENFIRDKNVMTNISGNNHMI